MPLLGLFLIPFHFLFHFLFHSIPFSILFLFHSIPFFIPFHSIFYSIPSDRTCDVLLVVPFDFQTNSLRQRDSQNVFEPDSEKHLDTHHSHILGHWTEPYTIVIIGRRGHRCHFCLDKHFVVTTVCCNKHMFVGTKHVFCHNKSMLTVTKLLSQQNYVCHDKIFLM